MFLSCPRRYDPNNVSSGKRTEGCLGIRDWGEMRRARTFVLSVNAKVNFLVVVGLTIR